MFSFTKLQGILLVYLCLIGIHFIQNKITFSLFQLYFISFHNQQQMSWLSDMVVIEWENLFGNHIILIKFHSVYVSQTLPTNNCFHWSKYQSAESTTMLYVSSTFFLSFHIVSFLFFFLLFTTFFFFTFYL